MSRRKNIDTIVIERLEVDCVVGINPWERLTKQRITIDIALDVDLSVAGKSDAVEDTIDYRTVVSEVTSEISESNFGLAEKLAERVAEICLGNDRVQFVEVTVRKPAARRNTSAIGVTIRRSR